jgi:hypothetical protein
MRLDILTPLSAMFPLSSFLATSGLFGIMIAMHKCAKIDIYGFQVHSRHGVVSVWLLLIRSECSHFLHGHALCT